MTATDYPTCAHYRMCRNA